MLSYVVAFFFFLNTDLVIDFETREPAKLQHRPPHNLTEDG